MLGTVRSMADEQQPSAAEPGPPNLETAPPVTSPVPPATSPVVPNLDTGYTAGGVPTLEGVREKIETRYGTALGATELAEETPEGRTATEQYEAQRKAAAEKLEEIRASMREQD